MRPANSRKHLKALINLKLKTLLKKARNYNQRLIRREKSLLSKAGLRYNFKISKALTFTITKTLSSISKTP